MSCKLLQYSIKRDLLGSTPINFDEHLFWTVIWYHLMGSDPEIVVPIDPLWCTVISYDLLWPSVIYNDLGIEIHRDSVRSTGISCDPHRSNGIQLDLFDSLWSRFSPRWSLVIHCSYSKSTVIHLDLACADPDPSTDQDSIYGTSEPEPPGLGSSRFWFNNSTPSWKNKL